MVNELNFIEQVASLPSRNFGLYFILTSSFTTQRSLQVNQRKAEIWSPKRQLLCKCMAGNPILENNAHSPELVSGHPRDSIVVAVLGPLCCCGEAAVREQSGYAHHIMQCFSPRAVVFSMEQVTFYRSLVFTQGYHPLRIQAKDSLGNPPGGS